MPWKIIDLTSIVDSQLPTMNHRLVLKSELLLKVADCLLQQNPKLKNRQRNLFLFDLGSYTSSG
jgi:hypothetical protein